MTGHIECVTYSTPFKDDSKVSLIRSCMDIPNNPNHTLTIGLDSSNNLLLLNDTEEGYTPINDYLHNTGSVSYSIHLDWPIAVKMPYVPRFYVSIYFDIFFHRKVAPFFLPYINFSRPIY